jgi:hypothetical protein
METIREGDEMVYPRSSQLPFSLPEEEEARSTGLLLNTATFNIRNTEFA